MVNWMKQHKLLGFIGTLVFVIATGIVCNSYITAWVLKNWLEKQGSTVELDDLTLSLWNSQLDINRLKAVDVDGNFLSLGHFTLNWSLDDIWDKKLHLSNITIDGIELTTVGERLKPKTIGSINLEALLANTTKAEFKQEESSPSVNEWSVEIGTIGISKFDICYQDGFLSFANLGLPVSHGTEKLAVCLDWENLLLNTAIKINPEGTAEMAGDIALNSFNIRDNQNRNLLQVSGLELKSMMFNSEKTSANNFSIKNLKALSQETNSMISDHGISLKQLDLKGIEWLSEEEQLKFENLITHDFGVLTRASDNKIHELTTIKLAVVDDVKLAGKNVSIKSIVINGMQAFENLEIEKQADSLLALKQMKFDKLNVTEDIVNLDSILLSGLILHVVSNEAGLNLDNWLPHLQTDDNSKVEKISEAGTPEANKSGATININNFALGDDSIIDFVDFSTGKAVLHQLSELVLSVEDIHLAEGTQQRASIKFKSKIGNNGSITGVGEFVPSNMDPEINIVGELKNINLINLTEYSARFVGYRIDSGNLNVGYEFLLKDQKIDAKFKSLFEKFNLANLQLHEKSELNEKLGLPLPLALDLLRNSDDSIELNLPVSGDVNDPNLSISGIVSTVTFKAIKNAIIYSYSPLGMLSVASGIFNLATALRFEPLTFAYRSTELSTESKKQLKKLAEIMKKKPKIKILICSVATELDRVVVEPLSKPVEPTPKSAEAPLKADVEQSNIVTEIELGELLELAMSRQKNAIDYLVDIHQIEPTRLLECNVKLSENKTRPAQVELSI